MTNGSLDRKPFLSANLRSQSTRLTNYALSLKTRLSPARIIELAIMAIIVVGFLVVAIAVTPGNWQIRPILSGSMEPGFAIGGVAITKNRTY